MSGNKKYIPVESNPEVFNSYTSKLGVNVAQHAFCDVFGLDEVRMLHAHGSML